MNELTLKSRYPCLIVVNILECLATHICVQNNVVLHVHVHDLFSLDIVEAKSMLANLIFHSSLCQIEKNTL